MSQSESPFRTIAKEVLFDPQPGIDGCSNADRAVYFCRVMDTEVIDLNENLDLTMLNREDDPTIVDALFHYLMLQLAYNRRLLDTGFLAPEEFQANSDWISLAVRRVKWHKKHLEKGVPTPPFSITE